MKLNREVFLAAVLSTRLIHAQYRSSLVMSNLGQAYMHALVIDGDFAYDHHRQSNFNGSYMGGFSTGQAIGD